MTKHNIWSISIIGLLFVLLFTPLVVSESLYFPFVTGKVFLFRSIISISLIAWLILVLKEPEYLPKKSGILAVSGLFIFFLFLSNLFGVDRANSFFSNFERMEGWFTHVYLFIYLIIVSSVLRTEKLWNWFFGISLVSANIVALYATFDSVSRTSVFLGNSTYVAIYALFNIFFAVLLAYRLYRAKIESIGLKYAGFIYYGLSALLLSYVVFRTQTRGTMLALIFSIVAFLILSAISYRKNKKVKIISVSLFVLAIALGALFWTNRDSQFVQNNPSLVRIATISPAEGTAKARLVNWGVAFDGIKERPLLGWGQENYLYVFAKHFDIEMYKEEPWFDRTHNSFIDWAVQGGLIAFVLYVGLFVSALWAIYKSTSLTRTEKNIFIAMLGAYAIHNMFVFDNYSSYLMFFGVLGFIVHHSQKENIKCDLDEKIKQAIVVFLILITLIVGYKVILQPYQVSRGLITVLTYKDANKIIDKYKSLFAKETFGNFEATIRLISDSSSFSQIPNPVFVKQYMDLAVERGEVMIADAPNNVRGLEFYGLFLLEQNMMARSIEVLEHARTLAPNRPNNLYILGFAYIKNSQLEEAKEVFEHVYNLNKDNEKARTYYGGSLLLVGDKMGEELIKDFDYNDPFFSSVFLKLRMFDRIIAISEKQIADNPNNHQAKLTLMKMYLYTNQVPKAIETVRKLIVDVPEFKEQGEFIIKEIQAGRNPAI